MPVLLPADTRIRVVLSRYLGWLYSPGTPIGPSYVEAPVSPGCAWVRKPDQPRQTVCSTFTGGVIGAAYDVHDAAYWLDMSIGDGARPFSSIEAVERVGVGQRVQAPVANRWHVSQGWTALVGGRVVKGAHGHAWLWYGDEQGLMTHASSSAGRVISEERAWSAQAKRYDEVRIALLSEA